MKWTKLPPAHPDDKSVVWDCVRARVYRVRGGDWRVLIRPQGLAQWIGMTNGNQRLNQQAAMKRAEESVAELDEALAKVGGTAA